MKKALESSERFERARRGFWGWFLQRVTAILLLLFLFLHIQVLHFTESWRLDFDVVSRRLSGQWKEGWILFYALFIPIVLFHGLNGLYGIFLDYAPSVRMKKLVFILLFVIGIAMTVFGFFGIRNLFSAIL